MRASQKTLVLAPLLALAVAMPALAQTGGPLTNYPVCSYKPTAQDSEAAHSAYNLGKRFFDEADYTTAIQNFAAAYKLDCSKPELLLNIARANELLGNRAEAVHALETYLQRATNATEDDKSQLQRRIDNLKALIAQQAASVAPVPVPTAPPVATAPIPSGTATPLPPQPPPPPEERHHSVAPWVLVGLGGASMIAGGVLYFVGQGDINSATALCKNVNGDFKCPAPAASQGNTGDTVKSAGSVTFWAGLGVTGAGILWHFLEPTGPVAKDSPKASFVPSVGPGYAGANVLGRF